MPPTDKKRIMPYVILRIALIYLLVVSLPVSAQSVPSAAENKLKKQRAYYLLANQAYEDNNTSEYRKLTAHLSDYPLYPYLEYKELSKQLKSLVARPQPSAGQKRQIFNHIDNFLSTHQHSYLGDLLLNKWLNYLAVTERWSDYVKYYQNTISKRELQCLGLKAKIVTKQALPSTEVEAIWLSAKSQPKACDFAFAHWEKQGHLTQQLLWQRHKLAIDKKNYSLGHYLQRKMNSQIRFLAQTYEDIYKNPGKISNVTQNLPKANNNLAKMVHDIITNGLHRYAYSNPEKALTTFNRINQSHKLPDASAHKIKYTIASRLIRKDKFSAAARVILLLPPEQRTDLLEPKIRHYLAQQDWQKINKWITELPEEAQSSDRWQYWKSRALKSLNSQGFQSEIATINKNLANSRSFYGFLAADKLGIPYQFEDEPSVVNTHLFNELSQRGHFQRAKEFLIMGEMHRARREWAYGVRNLPPEEHIAAAQLAHNWQWHRKAIESMAKAKYWNDIDIRFPVVHNDIIQDAAMKNSISPSIIFSIARQESAWEFDARSRVGARGLMQLMPATARQVAKSIKKPYVKNKLFEPAYNISLGSNYISGLLSQHNDNRALALASYNAGPHRVKKWLAKSQSSLPIDIWIETIPFKETRKYVQNVMSYEVIYNYQKGKQSKLLTLAEAGSQL